MCASPNSGPDSNKKHSTDPSDMKGAGNLNFADEMYLILTNLGKHGLFGNVHLIHLFFNPKNKSLFFAL